jgi:hypothetical protein
MYRLFALNFMHKKRNIYFQEHCQLSKIETLGEKKVYFTYTLCFQNFSP